MELVGNRVEWEEDLAGTVVEGGCHLNPPPRGEKRGVGRVPQEEASSASTGCGRTQQHKKNHGLFGPLHSLVLGSLPSGAIPGAGRYGWAIHGSGGTALGGGDVTPPQVHCKPRISLRRN